jgi:hypothetical protein
VLLIGGSLGGCFEHAKKNVFPKKSEERSLGDGMTLVGAHGIEVRSRCSLTDFERFFS